MAAARAVSRRGAVIMIFRPASQGASRRKRGMQVVLPAPGGACSTAQALFASVLCKRSRTVVTGRPFHGKLSKFYYYFLDWDSFDYDISAMRKNAKKQMNLQGLVLVQEGKLTKDLSAIRICCSLRLALLRSKDQKLCRIVSIVFLIFSKKFWTRVRLPSRHQ